MGNNKSLLTRLIKDRCNLFGETFSKIASDINVTPAQLSKFIKEEGPLNRESLELLLEKTGIELDCYEKRGNLAAEVAQILNKRGIKVKSLNKEEMISLTKKKEIAYFIEFKNKNEMKEFIKQGIIEKEATYYYFKGMVSLFEQLLEKKVDSQKVRSSATRKYWESENKELELESENKEDEDFLNTIITNSGLLLGLGVLVKKAYDFFSDDSEN